MDDGLGNYIYIIAFIAIVIINLLKKARANKEEAQNPAYEFEEKEEGEEVLREFFPPVTPKPYASPVQAVDIQQNKTIYPIITEPKKKHVGEELLISKDDDFTISFENADDARKAFIYSEIWARKY